MATSPKYIHNRKLLYFLFIVALTDFLYLVYTNDMTSVALFILVFILTMFFTKNMLIIIFVSFISTNVIKYGLINEYQEGFDGLDDIMEEEDKENNGVDEDEGYENGEPEPPEQPEPPEEAVMSVEGGSKKEGLKPVDTDKNVMEKTDKLILPELEVLERMNKYKPLLDTLNGLSKNMAAFS